MPIRHFGPGRISANGLPGAKTRGELLAALTEGRIKAALVIGEDPMRHNRTAALLGSVEFLAACDWAETETTLFANIAIPMTTYLETEGSRITMDGKVKQYHAAVAAPNGVKTWHVLRNIAFCLGVELPGVFSSIFAELSHLVATHQEHLLPMYWNTGETRAFSGKGRLTVADTTASSFPAIPALTACAQHKAEVQQIGLEHYR